MTIALLIAFIVAIVACKAFVPKYSFWTTCVLSGACFAVATPGSPFWSWAVMGVLAACLFG